MAEGLGVSIESLVGRSPLRDIVVRCVKDPDSGRGWVGGWAGGWVEVGVGVGVGGGLPCC